MWKKILLGVGVVLAAAFGGTYVQLYQPDIPRSVLEEKYAVRPSQFVTLADGARVHYRDRGPRDAPLGMIEPRDASVYDHRDNPRTGVILTCGCDKLNRNVRPPP